MSLMNQKGKSAIEKAAQDLGLTGDGIGESDDFLSQENHIFINKLNYVCKNYDTSFKDVSAAIMSNSNYKRACETSSSRDSYHQTSL